MSSPRDRSRPWAINDDTDSNSRSPLLRNNEAASATRVRFSNTNASVPRWYIPKRYILAAVMFWGYLLAHSVRYSFNIALVAMTNMSASYENISSGDECPLPYNNNTNTTIAPQKDGTFPWSPTTQGILIGAFYYGYAVSQVPLGYIAERYSAKLVFGMAIALTSALHLLLPTLAYWNVASMVAVRALMGLAQGGLWPSGYAIWGRWAPVEERTKLTIFSVMGGDLGLVISEIVSGILCDTNFLGGWPSPFYLFGGLGLLWMIPFYFLLFDTPSKHPRIHRSELEYIQNSLGYNQNVKRPPLPFRKMLTSFRVWMLVLVYFLDGYAGYQLLTSAPLYMKQILRYNITQDGFYSSLPYLLLSILRLFSAPLADFLLQKKILSVTMTRKLFSAIGAFSNGALLIGLSILECNRSPALAILVLSVGMGAFIAAGYGISPIDMAPAYSGTLFGLGNGLGNCGGFLAPMITELITKGQPSRSSWRIVFLSTAAVYSSIGILFCCFGTGEEQEWAKPKPKESEETPANETYGAITSSLTGTNVILARDT